MDLCEWLLKRRILSQYALKQQRNLTVIALKESLGEN